MGEAEGDMERKGCWDGFGVGAGLEGIIAGLPVRCGGGKGDCERLLPPPLAPGKAAAGARVAPDPSAGEACGDTVAEGAFEGMVGATGSLSVETSAGASGAAGEEKMLETRLEVRVWRTTLCGDASSKGRGALVEAGDVPLAAAAPYTVARPSVPALAVGGATAAAAVG